MMRFHLHTSDTAPPGSQDLLRRVQSGFGFLPNLFAKLAESASALAAYLDLRTHFEKCSLSPVEQQVVALAVSVQNGSTFCTSAHSYAARHLAGMTEDCIEALREGRELPDPRLNVLAQFTREIVLQRGRVDDGDLNVFLAAGYSMEQALEVMHGVALKTFTNYASHVVRPPLNPEFAAEFWTPMQASRKRSEGRVVDTGENAGDDADVTARNRFRH